MLSKMEGLFHPFGGYRKGKIELIGSSYYWRKFPNELWVMNEIGTDSSKSMRRVYKGYQVIEYKINPEEFKEFNSVLKKQKDLDKLRQEKLHKTQVPFKSIKSIDFKSSEAMQFNLMNIQLVKQTTSNLF